VIAANSSRSPRSLHWMRGAFSAALAMLALAFVLNNVGCLDPCPVCPPPSPTFTPGGLLNDSRAGHTATTLLAPQNQVLIVGGSGSLVLNSAEIYDPLTGSFSVGSSMNEARVGHTATSLQTGDVLIAGGHDVAVSNTAELYQFATGSFVDVGKMNAFRSGHAATLLSDGFVLITGGSPSLSSFNTNLGAQNSAELYNPISGFQAIQPMTSERSEHTATRLTNGSVLIAGGFDDKGRTLRTAEIYDPVTQSFSPIQPMRHPRRDHTAILTPDGSVLIAGGWDERKNPVNTAEIYDASGFVDGALMNEARAYHSSSLLSGGMVLVAGGDAAESAEVYSGGRFTELDTSNFSAGAASAAATIANGDVLISGGGPPVDKTFGYPGPSNKFANLFLSDGSGLLHVGMMSQGRSGPSAAALPAGTRLPDGTLLAAGGLLVAGGENVLASVSDELYGTFNNKSSIIRAFELNVVGHTATLFTSGPKAGSVLIAGGAGAGEVPLNLTLQTVCQAPSPPVPVSPLVWIYNPTTQNITPGFKRTGALGTPRYLHTATLLPNGMVLVTGGIDEAGTTLDGAELYNPDPMSERWSPVVAKMKVPRHSHAAALLDDGTVLIAGGCGPSGQRLTSAEIFNPFPPSAPSFTKIGDMRAARVNFTLTPLKTHGVLVAGGSGDTSAELYDETKSKFAPAGLMTDSLFGPTATLLVDGNVLITSGGSANAELYEPASNTFMLAGRMTIARSVDAAALLPDGKSVLVTGGFANSSSVTTATTEIYQPTSTPTPTPAP
jgi:hypothetical protein